MHCGNCSHENGTDARFCAECGVAMTSRCESCGAVQPAGAKFCNQCGASFTGPPTADRPVSGTNAVRKDVTALFGDLVGSTSFGEQVDPETARAVMADYFDLLRSTIEDHAGTVTKFMGDGVMAVFGIPEIAEDDAVRAVAAATELQQRFRSFAEAVREQHGVELGLRVGVNTGELVIGDDDADLVGDVLNTAARLEAACRPGRVLVGEDTWRLTRSSIAYEVLGEIRVKGKAAPIATFQVVAETNRTGDELTPFVGRRDELADLQGVFVDACDSSAARLATVIGAPGVGKTRLAAELLGVHDMRSFDLRFERRGSTTFSPVADLLRELTGTGSADDVAVLVADHPEAARLADVLSSLLGHGDARSTEESFWAVRRLLEFLAVDGPVTIVIDDIQWAEPLFWDLLDHLVEWTEAPVFLLALARPELRELRPELAQAGKRVSAAVALEGLDAATTRELAARLLDTDELPSELIDRLPDSTEGNPLFVRELVQMLIDDGVLERSDDRWRLTIDVDAIEVPPTILSLLASRVERLPDDERQVVELASVIGTEFDRGTLSALASVEVAARLGAVIDRLRRKDLLEPAGSWAGDHPLYRFHHVLIRDAAYRRLLKAHRADLHERVGRRLESIAGTDELDVTIAHHYELAHSYRSDLGTLDAATVALAGEAAKRLQSAAVLALSREDLSSSGSSALRALALVGDGDGRDDLLTLGCEALLSSGDVARGAPLVDELVERSADARLTAWADCFRAQLWSLTDSERLVEASDLAEAAARRLAELGDDAGVAKARLVRASTLARLGRVGDCEAELDLALAAARAAGDRRRTVAVLGAAPMAALWGPSPVARAGGRCLDVLRLLRITTTSPAVEATSIRCQGMLEALRGRFDSAREKFETSRSTAHDLGLRHGLYETELFAGFVELLAGDPLAAEHHLLLARDGLGALGIGADAGQASSWLARSLLRQGRVDEAEVLASEALAAAGQHLQIAIGSRAVLAEVRARQGRHDEARQLVDAALDIAEPTDITLDRALALRSAARVDEQRGDLSAANRHWVAATEMLASKGVTGLSTAVPPASHGSIAEPTADERTHPAWEVVLHFSAALRDGDGERARSWLSPGYEYGWHDPLRPTDRTASTDEHVSALIASTGNESVAVLVATRGDEDGGWLVLGRGEVGVGSASAATHFVVRVRGGLIERTDWFGSDQPDAAYDELDRRWVELGGRVDPVATGVGRAMSTGPFEEYAAWYAPDFEVVDHREAGMGRRNRSAYLESTRSIVGNVTAHGCVEYVAIADGLSLIRTGMTSEREGATWELYLINQHDGERITRWEQFPISGRDRAFARFRELLAESDESTADLPERRATVDLDDDDGNHRPVVANAASRAMDQFAEAVNDGDLDRFVAMMHADYEHHLRQHLRVAERMTRGDAIELTRTMIAGNANLSCEAIAVRGDEIALGRLTSRFPAGDVPLLYVLGLRDGLIHRAATFDPDQLGLALDELDRWWSAAADPATFGRPTGSDHAAVRCVEAFVTAWNADDLDGAKSLLDPDLAAWSHRNVVARGTVRGADAHDAVLSFHEFMPRCHVDLVTTRSHDLALVEWRLRSADGIEEQVIPLVLQVGPTGLIVRAATFDPDDIDGARSVIDDWDTRTATGGHGGIPSTTGPSLANTASGLADELAAVYESGDTERLGQIISADFTWRHRTRLAAALGAPDRDRDSYLQGALARIGTRTVPPTIDRQLLAVRGDELFLARSLMRLGDDETERLVIGRSANGQLVELIHYDENQLDEAQDELDRMHIELGGPARLVDIQGRYRRALAAGDVDAARQVLSAGLVIRDHRPLAMPDLDRVRYLDSTVRHARGTRMVVSEIRFHTDDVALERVRFDAHDQSTWGDQWSVVRLDEDGLASIDVFGIEDVDAAAARYRELAGSADRLIAGSRTETPPAANRARETEPR